MRRITQISVTKLFGMFDYIIPLNLDDGITIIHGLNGSGKTIILTLLNELFNKRGPALQSMPFNRFGADFNDYSNLPSIPFDEFRVDFNDNSSFWVTKTAISSEHNSTGPSEPKITFHANIQGKIQDPYQLKRTTQSSPFFYDFELQSTIASSLKDELDTVGMGLWQVRETGEGITLEALFERYSDRLPESTRHKYLKEKEPGWLNEIRSSIPIGFIQTERLLNYSQPYSIPKQPLEAQSLTTQSFISSSNDERQVKNYSNDLAYQINSILSESVALSQSLDRTFPARAVNPSHRELSVGELQKRLDELERKRSRLTNAGLLNQDDGDFQIYHEIDERTAFVLSVYVEDVEKKLGVFDKIVTKIDLLTTIINKRFTGKRMTIDKNQGFVIITPDETPLSPDKLSSGEQHELVLFYELLFKIEPGSLILIDEPELSLHIEWQLEFLKDLQEITRLINLDVLIATHSPQIINDRWDLTVQLEGPHR